MNSTHHFVNGYWISFLGSQAAWRGGDHFHPVPRLTISGTIPPLRYMPSWSAQEERYLIASKQSQQYTSN